MAADFAVETVPFAALSAPQREQAAATLIQALAHVASAWSDMAQAREELQKFFDDAERLAIGALDDDRLVGWIGGIRHSDFGWELHPLVVDPSRQGRGIGTLLVRALEDEARRAGACTIWLGSDDDFGGTNLFGVDLYPDVLQRLQALAPAAAASRHPYSFYRRLGYAVVGVLPDVDGMGKHDILMAKRI
jgi:GNAT superfamily N-acetyltransferase